MNQYKSLIEAIEALLADVKRPISTKEINELLYNSYNIKVGGNPIKTINARLTEEIMENGSESTFMRTSAGIYTLRKLKLGSEHKPTNLSLHYSRDYMNQVLVFPREFLANTRYFHGIRKDFSSTISFLFGSKDHKAIVQWMTRANAETNYGYKQIVTYGILKFKSQFLIFSRGKWTSLRDNKAPYSLGVGGHVQLSDIGILDNVKADDFNKFCIKSLTREISEEIGATVNNENIRMIGILNDDSVEQGEQHFAFLYQIELLSPIIEKKERWINRPHLVSGEDLFNKFDSLEYWSQLYLQAFYEKKVSCKIQIKPNFSLRNQSEIILIAGYIGSGKTIACEFLEKNYGFVNIKCSKIMQSLIGCGPIEEIGRRRLQDLGEEFITKFNGHERLAQGIIDYVNNHPSPHYVLDGLRYPETYDNLSRMLNRKITVIYIDTLIENLYKNFLNREYEHMTINQFLSLLSHPVEKVVQRFRPKADIIIHNNGTLGSFLVALNDYFKNELS